MGRLCLESNKTRRLGGEQGVPLGVLIDSRELDLHAAAASFKLLIVGSPSENICLCKTRFPRP